MTSISQHFKALSCAIKGHNMKISMVVNPRVTETCCSSCGKQMTTNIYGELVPLNDHYSRINRSLRQLAIKKDLKKLAGMKAA